MIDLRDTVAPPSSSASAEGWAGKPSESVERRACEIAARDGRDEPNFNDRALAWSECLETGWLHASAEIPLSTFFRIVCARAVCALRYSECADPDAGGARSAGFGS